MQRMKSIIIQIQNVEQWQSSKCVPLHRFQLIMVDIKCVQICQMQEWVGGDCMNLIVSEIENLQMIQIIQESWVQSGYVIRWQVECNQGVKPTVWKKNTTRLCPNMFS